MKFFSLSALLMLSINVIAQVGPSQNQIATFEDGTKISYSVQDNVGDNQFANTIAAFNQADNRDIGCYSLMYGRLQPDRFYAYGELGMMFGNGFAGVSAGGIYFLASSEKEYMLPMSIRSVSSGNTETKYVIKTPAIKNKHLGAHFEAGYKRYNVLLSTVSTENRSYQLTSLSSGQVAIGLGYVSTKQALVKVDGKSYMGGSRLFKMTADLLVYPGMKFESTPADSASASVPLTLKDFSQGAVGFRVQIEGQGSFKFKKKSILQTNFGFFYRLGVMKAAYVSPSGIAITSSGISGIFALGFFFKF